MNVPVIFEFTLSVSASDIDELNHVNNVVYFKYLQDAALAHWYGTVNKDVSDALRWVAKKHEIEYFKPAFEADILTVKTWIKELKGVSSHREYEIYRHDTLIVKASTQWIALDAISMKPKRLDLDLMKGFFE